jgi:exodeoxyribonuclease VII small subunit
MVTITEIEPEESQGEEISYEEALSELEQIVSAMETDQSSLEESLALFERGRALVARCAVLLGKAELQLQTLLPQLEDDFEPSEEEK